MLFIKVHFHFSYDLSAFFFFNVDLANKSLNHLFFEWWSLEIKAKKWGILTGLSVSNREESDGPAAQTDGLHMAGIALADLWSHQ